MSLKCGGRVPSDALQLLLENLLNVASQELSEIPAPQRQSFKNPNLGNSFVTEI
jgi:hypothetical protein